LKGYGRLVSVQVVVAPIVVFVLVLVLAAKRIKRVADRASAISSRALSGW
jgi:uncharacterized paraquat-inducible protein A